MVSGGYDPDLFVWKDWEIQRKIPMHSGGINGLIFHDNFILTRSREANEAKLTDIEQAKTIYTVKGGKFGLFTFAASWESNLLISSVGRYITCWDLRTGTEAAHWSGPSTTSRFEVLRLPPNGNMLATGDAEGDCALWDLRAVQASAKPESCRLRYFPHGLSPISDLYVDSNKFVAASKAGVVKIWDLNQETTAQSQSQSQSQTPSVSLVSGVWCFQADDRALVCGNRMGEITILDFGEDLEEQVKEGTLGKTKGGSRDEASPSCLVQ
jgi:WD40 repeat protein